MNKLRTVPRPRLRATLWLAASVLPGLHFVTTAAGVDFAPIQTLQGGIGFTTALDFGPEDPDPTSVRDGCVYALNGQTGEVHRICFDGAKFVTSDTVVIDLNGPAMVQHALGLAFDPKSDPADEIRLYIAYSVDGTAPFNGAIARAVSIDGGANYIVDETFITGLPREKNPPGNNQTNGLAFGPDGCLYIAQGSNANSGYSADFSESRLAGAVVRACFNDANGNVDPTFDRNCGSGNFVEACGLEVYASGFRNPYDLVWHSNGLPYSTDNDASLGFGLDCGMESNNYGCPCQEPTVQPIGDELNLVEHGRYYGSPNPYLAMPSGLQCRGGSNASDACTTDANCPGGTCVDLSILCTDSLCGDVAQCYYFGFGEDPIPGEDPNGTYRQPLLQTAGLMDGITEYRSKFGNLLPGSFCSDWDDNLLVTGGPGPLRRIGLSADGRTATDEGTTNLVGANGLDVVVGPDGTIYLADFTAGAVTFLSPIEQPDTMAPDFFIEACGGGQLFADDFNRASLGSNWVVDSQSFSIIGNELVEDSGQRFREGQMRWVGGVTETIDQFGKLQVTDPQTHSWGFIFRAGTVPGDHYEVLAIAGTNDWSWARYDPTFAGVLATCMGDGAVGGGNWVGATIEGVGATTSVSTWRWDTDPDLGGPVDITANWGPADCTMTGIAAPFDDNGTTVGIRSYTGSSTANSLADKWTSGDLGAGEGTVSSICTDDADCDDANVCTDDVCDPLLDCMNTNNTLPCDDGNACTGNDTCGGGICAGGPPNHCGNGILQTQCGEECDDGGQVGGDGCSASCALEGAPCATQVRLVLDGSGTGTPGSLLDPDGVVTDAAGNVYVAACGTSTGNQGVFKVTPAGGVTKIAGGPGDGMSCPVGIDVDSAANVYVVGFLSDNAFKVTPSGVVTQIIGPSGDGANALSGPLGLVVDDSGNVFVTGNISNNVFRITPGGVITEIIDSGGNGTDVLSAPFGVAADGSGNVFVAGLGSDNVFKITPGGTITQIMDATGDGTGNLLAGPHDISVDSTGTCYVTGNASDNVFKITSGGVTTRIMDSTGDGLGNALDNPTGIAVDQFGNVYVAAWVSQNAFRIAPDGVITQIIDAFGDGANTFERPADFCVAVDLNQNVFMTGTASANTFKISISGVSCGDGVVDSCEECDDAGESVTCDVDCSLADCGDGVLNLTSGEQCEADGDCLAAEICAASCNCVPEPVCGDATVDLGEECDAGAQSATCDADCTFPACGDGILNMLASEECETNTDCAAGDICQACTCTVPPPGQVFADDFNRASLGSNWVVDSQSFSIIGNELVEDSGQRFREGQMRWVGGVTETIDQFGKLQVTDPQTHSWGFIFRAGTVPGDHYEVLAIAGTNDWSWARYDPAFAGVLATCMGDGAVGGGDWLGATIEGVGATTSVSIWRWDTDPDLGGPVDITANWGPADCTMTSIAPPFVDIGTTVGIRSYTGSSSTNSVADNWKSGDLSAVSGATSCDLDIDCDDGDVCNGSEFCDVQDLCQPGTPLSCDDGDACNGVEACDPALGCELGTPPICDDLNPCTDDSCGPVAGCQSVDNTALCDDGAACTSGDTCTGGVCSGADNCPQGEACDLGTGTCIVPPPGQVFADDFNRASLGSNWVVDSQSFSIIGNELVEDSGQRFREGQMRWVGGVTETIDQFGKLQVTDPQTHSWGFIFRASAVPGDHYEILAKADTNEWAWARYDPSFVGVLSSCLGDGAVAGGNWVGATIEGVGATTSVSTWRWDTDPDLGGPVDITANWGPADCTMTGIAAPFDDNGTTVGIRSYTGSSSANSIADNWKSGDLSSANGP